MNYVDASFAFQNASNTIKEVDSHQTLKSMPKYTYKLSPIQLSEISYKIGPNASQNTKLHHKKEGVFMGWSEMFN